MATFRRGHEAAISDEAGVMAVTSISSTSQKLSEHKRFTLGSQLKATIFNSWINLLLIAAPVGIAMHFVNVSPVAVFAVNFIAIIPLAAMLSYATEEIALRIGETLGGLLNATFGFVYTAVFHRILLTCS
jgi:Ca2+:H+ antiporter